MGRGKLVQNRAHVTIRGHAEWHRMWRGTRGIRKEEWREGRGVNVNQDTEYT